MSNWPDRSGNGHDLAALSAEWRPTLHHALPGFKGRPAVFFGGIMKTDWGTALAQPWHAFFVIQGEVSADYHYIFDGVADGQRFAIFQKQGVGGPWVLYAGFADLTGGSVTTMPPQVMSARAHGANSQLRQNGLVIASGNPGTNAVRGVMLGARFNAIRLLNGWIAEGLLYHGAMSSADMAAADAYLLAKYGIT